MEDNLEAINMLLLETAREEVVPLVRCELLELVNVLVLQRMLTASESHPPMVTLLSLALWGVSAGLFLLERLL